MSKIDNERVNFCVAYLVDNGIDASKFEEIARKLTGEEPLFRIIKNDDAFFKTLAEKLRELWPAGEKDGKYPWRGSIPELTKRLQFIWAEQKLDDYSIDDCLVAARRYLAQFENHSVKYMRTLPYFIFKQEKTAKASGLIACSYKSPLAEYLTNSVVEETGWEMMEGELI